MISTGRSCPQKLLRQYVQHYKPRGESIHLIAGGAFAHAIEAARRSFYEFREDAAIAEARAVHALIGFWGAYEAPEGEAKSLERMVGALLFYLDEFPLGADKAEPILIGGKLGIEFSFCLPLQVKHPVTGEPLLYAGRSDMVAAWRNGVWPHDEKTAGSQSKNWAMKWDLRSQFTGYCYALREFGIKPTGVVTRGIVVLKTMYHSQSAPSYRAEWEIDRWYDNLCEDLESFIWQWKREKWRFNFDDACNSFSGCPFTRVCKSLDPVPWLGADFTRRVWSPLERKEIPLVEWEQRWGEGTEVVG